MAISDEVLIFANPVSGRGRSAQIAHQLAARLREEGYQPTLHLDRPSTAAAPQVPPAAAIVIGGDGTLRDVAAWSISRMLQRHDPASMPPLLVVPMGTANLMGQYLRAASPDDLETVVTTLRRRNIMLLDAAQANDSLCLLLAGVGFDGAVVHELERIRRGPISKASYLLPMLHAAIGYEYPPLSVEVDGRRVWDERPAMVFVGNVPQYGAGFPVLPLARPDDAALDVCILACDSLPRMVELFMYAAAGEHLRAEGVLYLKGGRIKVRSPQFVPVQIDGEAAGFTPLDVRLLPMRIPFFRP